MESEGWGGVVYWVQGTGGLVHALSAKRGMKEEGELRTPMGFESRWDRLHPRVPMGLGDASQPRSVSPDGLIDFPGAFPCS